MECIPALLRDSYASDFRIADAGFFYNGRGRVVTTTTKRNLLQTHWTNYVQPLGLDPFLQKTPYTTKIQAISGFAGRMRTGYYGQRRQISAPAVTTAITAVGTTIALATGFNPTRMRGAQDKLVPRLSQMLLGLKEDSPTIKKLPIEVNIPEYISLCSLRPSATERTKATADLITIAFYYLLRVGEYTIKGSRNTTKQTVRFQMKHVTFFKHDHAGRLQQLSRMASDADILTAHSATLRLENQKNGWKGVCIHQECNGDPYHCPMIHALGQGSIHIHNHTRDTNTCLSTLYPPSVGNQQYDAITDKDMSSALKLAAVALEYPTLKGIPVDRVDTHSLCSGGTNALALSGYSDRKIQKMGCWRSATFKEYIQEELNIYSVGMSTNMKRHFNFVNIAGGVYHDVTNTTILSN